MQYFEAGVMRPRRVTVGALAYGLDPDDPERRQRIVAALIAAAGGEGALAADGGWRRYRKRRFERGMLNGSVPLPSDIAHRLAMHQRASALRRQAYALLERPDALDDGDILDRSSALLCEASAAGVVTMDALARWQERNDPARRR